MQTGNLPHPDIEHAYSSEKIWTLHYKGSNIKVRIEVVPEPKKPGYFNRVWRLLSLSPTSLENLKNEEIIILLEEALQVYGYMGIRIQKPNTTVELRVK